MAYIKLILKKGKGYSLLWKLSESHEKIRMLITYVDYYTGCQSWNQFEINFICNYRKKKKIPGQHKESGPISK